MNFISGPASSAIHLGGRASTGLVAKFLFRVSDALCALGTSFVKNLNLWTFRRSHGCNHINVLFKTLEEAFHVRLFFALLLPLKSVTPLVQ
jgi:hypothetical protein